MLIPRVKEERILEGTVLFPKTLKVFDPTEDAKRFMDALRIIFPEKTIEAAPKGEALMIREDLPQGSAEEYALCVDRVVTVSAKDHAGAVHAAVTLKQLVTGSGIPRCEIRDRPDSAMRCVMVDAIYAYTAPGDLKKLILRAALAKYSHVNLHLMDTHGLAYRSEVLPEIPREGGPQYTLDELRDIRDYCETLGMVCFGSLDFPNHGTLLLKLFPELGCDCPDGKRSARDWSLCLNNDKVFDMIKKLVVELDSVLPCDFVHLCGDEPSFADLKPPMLNEWSGCRRCRGLGENDSDRFCAFVRRILDEILRPMGKKIMIYNDAIDISRPVDLPREDVLIAFWRIALPGRGPVEGCSMEEFLKAGFEVLNLNYVDCYFDLPYGRNEASLSLWNPKQLAPADSTAHKHLIEEHPEKLSGIPFASGETAKRVLGGEMDLWAYGSGFYADHYEYTLPGAFFLFGDRLWNDAALPMDETTYRALGRAVLGEDSEIFNVFGEALIPVPALIDDGQALTATLKPSLPNSDPERYRDIIRQLERISDSYGPEADAARAYLRLIGEALES